VTLFNRTAFLVGFGLLIIPTHVFAQRDIEPKLIFSDTSNFSFTGEWQYLSTDIYLFNGERFSNLINELDFTNSKQKKGLKRKKGLSEEYLEYLFITASLKNVKFFGDNDLTYPLYNFQISRDKDSKYRTYVSDNIDHIRIIDNLPLYSASNYIDAEIRVRAISNNDKDQILSLVATQLKNISKILNPTEALLGIIGEFGNFIDANTRKKEYRFSSTIRLFEQKNFDTRVHSIKIYALSTANSNAVELNPKPLSDFLDTINHSTVNKPLLKKMVPFSEYPLIIVVNYKSLYNMVEVTGDEVNFASIEKRKFKIENDFRTGLINAETYRQEKDYINFLTVFANLKNHLEVYGLNYKTGNTDAIGGSLFRLLQYYRQLLKTFEELKYKYKGNTTYQNVFCKEYESILGYASLYLDDDHNLKQLKQLVKTVIELEANPVVPPQTLESTISTLRFSDLFKSELMTQSQEGQLINSHIKRLEELLYQTAFEDIVKNLSETKIDLKAKNAPSILKQMVRSTSCGICSERGFAAIKEFEQRYAEYLRQQELIRRDSIVTVLQPWLFTQIERLQLAKANFTMLKPEGSQTESALYLVGKVNEADRDIGNIKDFIKIDVSTKELSIIQNLNLKLLTLKLQAEELLNLVCKLRPELFIKNQNPDVLIEMLPSFKENPDSLIQTENP